MEWMDLGGYNVASYLITTSVLSDVILSTSVKNRLELINPEINNLTPFDTVFILSLIHI